MAEKKGRIEYIDVAKGIGIILVVLGHLDVKGQISREIIYSFHVPLFFMLSGMFIGSGEFLKSLKKNFRTVYIPFFSAVIFDAVLKLCIMAHQKAVDFKTLAAVTGKVLIGLQNPIINSPLWFLFSLFVIKTVFSAIMLIKRKAVANTVIGVITAAALAFVIWTSTLDEVNTSLYSQSVAPFIFFSAGYFLKTPVKALEKAFKERRVTFNIIGVAAAGAWVPLAIFNGDIDIHNLIFSNLILFFVNAFLGSFCLLILSLNFSVAKLKPVKRIKKALVFYGANTVVILITHYYIATRVLIPLFRSFGIFESIYSALPQIILLTITMLIMVPMIMLFNKYLYFIIGKTPVKKRNS